VLKTIGTVLSTVFLGVAAATALVYSGAYNVAATDRHSGQTHSVFEMARVRSIKAHAAGIAPPADLASEARVVAGTSHFAEHCAMCHTAPGVEAQDLADGMYPKPPVLTDAGTRYSPGELFWIVRNGIKMSGMPAWGADHSDDDLWNTVAFMQRLPTMSEQDYGKLIMASMAAGGHHMHGSMPMPMDATRVGSHAAPASPVPQQ